MKRYLWKMLKTRDKNRAKQTERRSKKPCMQVKPHENRKNLFRMHDASLQKNGKFDSLPIIKYDR